MREMTSADHPAYLQLVEAESGIQITNDAQFQSIFLSISSENTLILSLLTVPEQPLHRIRRHQADRHHDP